MKKIVIIAVCLALLAAGVFVGRPAYRHWQQGRLHQQAEEFLAKGDFRNAGLAAQQALKLDSGDVLATRIMAKVMESQRSPQSLGWWQRLVDLEPESVQNRLALARAAFLLGENSRVDQALGGIAVTNRNSATFHQLAAMLAVAENDLLRADWHFSEATRCDPTNKSLQLNQAILHLHAQNTNLVESAINTLESLSADDALRRDALRHLVMAAVRNGELTRAEEFSRQLQSVDRTTFEDQVLYLSVLDQAKSPDFGKQLEALKSECATNAFNVPALASWLAAHGRLDEAIRWMQGLSADVQTNQAHRVALADAYCQRKSWEALERFLQGQNWGDYDFVRLAYLTHAAYAQGQTIVGQDHWRAAVRGAAERARAVSMLARLAADWKMDAEREDLLWMIVQRHPAERWALQALSDVYLKTGNSQGLQRIYATQLNFDPDNIIAGNNFASISLLLNAQLNRANELAQRAYEKFPQNPAFATTYAYSLHLRGRSAEGLKVLEAFPPKVLEAPSIAVYYAAMLAAAGETAKVRAYRDFAAASSDLLPEEKELLNSIR